MKKILSLILLLSVLTGCDLSSHEVSFDADLRYPLQENKGQYPKEVLYTVKYQERTTYITTLGITFDRQYEENVRHVVQLAFLQGDFHLQAGESSGSESSVFSGDTHITGIQGFRSVTAGSLYDGVALTIYPQSEDVAFAFSVEERALIPEISFSLLGCDELALSEEGDLNCTSSGYTKSFPRPQVSSGSLTFDLREDGTFGYRYEGDETGKLVWYQMTQ